MACFALGAETAVTEGDDILPGYPVAGEEPRQDQVEEGGFVEHDAPRQPHDGHVPHR